MELWWKSSLEGKKSGSICCVTFSDLLPHNGVGSRVWDYQQWGVRSAPSFPQKEKRAISNTSCSRTCKLTHLKQRWEQYDHSGVPEQARNTALISPPLVSPFKGDFFISSYSEPKGNSGLRSRDKSKLRISLNREIFRLEERKSSKGGKSRAKPGYSLHFQVESSIKWIPTPYSVIRHEWVTIVLHRVGVS